MINTIQCGLCWNKLMCESCMKATLAANGLPVNDRNINKLKEVKERGNYGEYTNYNFVNFK